MTHKPEVQIENPNSTVSAIEIADFLRGSVGRPRSLCAFVRLLLLRNLSIRRYISRLELAGTAYSAERLVSIRR
jgi:hypothetical protein